MRRVERFGLEARFPHRVRRRLGFNVAGAPRGAMANLPLYPLSFAPIYQYRLWGGRRLARWLETPLPGEEPIGKSRLSAARSGVDPAREAVAVHREVHDRWSAPEDRRLPEERRATLGGTRGTGFAGRRIHGKRPALHPVDTRRTDPRERE